MAYASWSVVFGEQPSAAKWNILGTNDSTFDTILTFDRQDDTTDSETTEPVIQYGWGFITGDGASRDIDETVTFPAAYTTVPIVQITPLGYQTSDPSGPGDTGASVGMTFKFSLVDTTTTTFEAQVTRVSDDGTDPGTLGASSRYLYSWLAIGT